MFRLIQILLFLGCVSSLSGQSPLDEVSKIKNQRSTLGEIISQIEDVHDIYFSYSPDNIPLDAIALVPNKTLRISQLLEYLLIPYDIQFNYENEKVLLYSSLPQTIQIYGVVRDKESKESIPSASVEINFGSNEATANGEGFFSLSIPIQDTVSVAVYALGYEPVLNYFPLKDIPKVYELEILPYYDTIIIDPSFLIPSPTFNPSGNSEKISLDAIRNSPSTLGNPDLLQALRKVPSVNSGSEAQNGFLVRGSSPDQNLILFDGMPIYESSHLGGLSSIFQTESIKNVEFSNSGIPARYGGRLASVLKVQTKDGDQNEYKRILSLGIEGISLHLNGPLIKEKTSLSFSGRRSWFGALSEPFVKSLTNVSEYGLSYEDTHAKITHWFSPTNQLSISAYTGLDRLTLGRTELFSTDDLEYELTDLNNIQWGNDLIQMNWKAALGKYIFINLQSGFHQYSSRYFGSIEQLIMADMGPNRRNIESEYQSSIRDNLLKLDLDIFSKEWGEIRLGAGIIDHRYQPSISEASLFTEADSSSIELDAYESYFYIEDRFTPIKGLNLNLGIRYSIFDTENTVYRRVEPRFAASFERGKSLIRVGYSKMNQFNHLLINPGPGLPSDLWIPSTDAIGPQTSDEISFNYAFNGQNQFEFGIGLYHKWLNNQIEYLLTSDVFYALLNDQNIIRLLPSNVNWQESITSGKGRAYGLELFMEKSYDRFYWSLKYVVSRSYRSFESINNGVSFPFSFDRTHDLFMLATYKLSSRSSLSTAITYGTGFPFTLAYEESQDGSNGFILNVNTRNNYRQSDFFHMDIQYKYSKRIKDVVLEINAGIYNITANNNPYYTYLFERVENSSENQREFGLKQIGLLNILPQVTASIIW